MALICRVEQINWEGVVLIIKLFIEAVLRQCSGFHHEKKNGFVTATNKVVVIAATKNFAASTKRFVDRTKHFVVTKYFCYPYIN